MQTELKNCDPWVRTTLTQLCGQQKGMVDKPNMFQMVDRKTVLLIDNCPAHEVSTNLSNVHMEYFPPNCTSRS
ncbi:hypothetical protein T11_17548 [Trichinella zimbabwensis]|uniref:Uncharacterized protein n=1 Tax=Trichinella zimbabwensis TaxID=268475 RepID=A0A0V1HZ04_9BILA|nr:hypothetical protein T11_17548 [Trichinella zimbabwensis]